MTDRPRIPQKIADSLMFANDHTCCVCRAKGKQVQIHHIDGDDSNNDISNLAVLCLECHSRVTGNEGLGRRYTSGEIKGYKRTWEHLVRERLIGVKPQPLPGKEEISYFDLTISEVLAMEDGDPRIGEKLKTLYELNIFKGCTDEILDSFHHLAIMSSMSQKRTASMLAEIIPDLFLHLVGPDKVPIEQDDKNRVKRGIELLGTIGSFNGEFSKDIEVIEAVCDSLYNMFEIAVWYNLEEIGTYVFSQLRKTKEACLVTFEDSEKPLDVGANYVNMTIQRVKELLEQNSIAWPSSQIEDS